MTARARDCSQRRGVSRRIARQKTAQTHLVERSIGEAVSLDTLSLSQSLLERSSKSQGAVLGRVVVVDVQVTLAVERERHASVFGQRSEHLP